MDDDSRQINDRYEQFYSRIPNRRVYPTEFVVRTFLASYPNLKFTKPQAGDSILDVAFGDGRNTLFLCELGLKVSGIEITEGIVAQTQKRLHSLGVSADLKVGRNSQIPYSENSFDYILASHCIYYCDEGETLIDNLREYGRVLKTGGFLIASVASSDSYIFAESELLIDGSRRILSDPYENRNGYRLFAFDNTEQISDYFKPVFDDFSFGLAHNDYFGIGEKVFWVVCKRK
jgi:ubiquinone/menaquinone biosynthesis C-methylase UbiE